MCVLIVFLLLTAALFGAGAALHALWWVALAMLVLWLLGFLFRPRSGRGRWYYW
jgi:energy-coupling factor transporter transmembrane protein EcfT